MAIHFHLKGCPRRKQSERATNTVTSISAKAADALALAKLRHTVADLEDEIMLQMCTIGELVYATHRGTPSDSDHLQKILEYVDDLEDEIEGHEQQIKLLLGIVPCPVCGEDVADDDVYCQKCGQPLPVVSDL